MPQQNNASVTNNFVGGLKTEATALNFPENACFKVENCIFDLLGTVSRRRGFNAELGATAYGQSTFGALPPGNVVVGYMWRNVLGDGNVNVYVVQVGDSITFFNIRDDQAASSQLVPGSFSLTGFQISGTPPIQNAEAQFTDGNGFLFITHPYCDPIAVSFATGTMLPFRILINIRDFDGVTDTVPVNQRMTFSDYTAQIPPLHLYNLMNQGWTDGAHGDATQTDLIDIFATLQGTIAKSIVPSNSDVWQTFKGTTGTFAPTAASLTNINTGSTQAPNGHAVLNAFDQDRDVWIAQNLPPGSPANLPKVVTAQRPSTSAFYAGRVFYAGVADSQYIGNIYFSQIIDSVQINDAIIQIGSCFQQNDPTSDTLFDLLPTDGGVIKIANAGTIYKLFAIQNGLLVFASNGIWLISGNQGIGFTAVDYSVNKISAVRCISGSSFVDVQGLPLFWGQEGIYSVQPGKEAVPYGVGGGLTVTSLTDHTIRSFFQSIPQPNRAFVRGSYNPGDFTVSWIFREAIATTFPNDNYSYDSVLNFNTLSGAFYPWTIGSSNSTQIRTIFVMDKGVVLDGEDNTSVDYINKYFISFVDPSNPSTTSYTMADVQDNSYVDWNFVGHIDYTSFFTTGYRLGGQAWRKFQSGYVYVYSDNFSNTSYSIQGLWNFAGDPNSGKWSGPQIVTNMNNKYDILYKRHRIRGIGNALQLKITSLPGQPFVIIGWAIWEQINASV